MTRIEVPTKRQHDEQPCYTSAQRSSNAARTDHRTMTTHATPASTRRYAKRFAAKAAEGHFREGHGLCLSSLGIGTYLGQPDAKTDESYTAAVVAAAEGGINVIDTAINYRLQRSERSIGAAIKQLAAKGIAREELILCTKGGYLTPDGSMPADPNEYFFREYLQPGVLSAADIVAGSHCMTPRYLEDQLGRSLRNLGVDCIDVYYLHNPETQLGEVLRPDFLNRVRQAFEFLESAVAAGEIKFFGHGNLDGLRPETEGGDFLFFSRIGEIARPLAGDSHPFP